MTDTDQVKLLLEKVGLIRWKHSDVLRDPQYQFNVFSMLREPHDEVYLHSKFLAELLNPKGDHCQADAFLQLFLQYLDLDAFPSQDAEVTREYNNIDIFISAGKHAIIIENKIHASDQDRQLERYFGIASRRGFKDITIVYLTPRGDRPSRQSLGTLADHADQLLHCLSYEEDIHAWLDECVQSVSRHPVVRETIVQYQRLIESLTGHSLSKEYSMEVRDLLMDEKNIALATDISQALVKARIEVQFTFWKELEKRLREQGSEVSDGSAGYPKYSRRRVRRYYERGRRNRYGIAIKLDELTDGTELLFFVQVRVNLYYGFIVVRDGERAIAEESQFDELAKICKQLDESFKRSSRSLGWKYPSKRVNFRDFDDDNAFALADPKKRQNYIDDLVAEIKTIIHGFLVCSRERLED